MTAEERMALTWQLSVESWSLAGKEIPAYGREEIPVRYVAPTDRSGDRASY
jgi:hypothetical protein